jgi:hypothetical protein
MMTSEPLSLVVRKVDSLGSIGGLGWGPARERVPP